MWISGPFALSRLLSPHEVAHRIARADHTGRNGVACKTGRPESCRQGRYWRASNQRSDPRSGSGTIERRTDARFFRKRRCRQDHVGGRWRRLIKKKPRREVEAPVAKRLVTSACTAKVCLRLRRRIAVRWKWNLHPTRGLLCPISRQAVRRRPWQEPLHPRKDQSCQSSCGYSECLLWWSSLSTYCT